MRPTLRFKFIIIYIIYGFLILFSVSAIASQRILSRLEKQTAEALYAQSNLTASNYLTKFFYDKMSFTDTYNELHEIKNYMSANVWFVKPDGSKIISCTLDGQPPAPEKIIDFDPAENGNKFYKIGNYHNYFDEDMMTIITPVITGFSPKGYLLIHKPFSSLEKECRSLLLPVYITSFVIYVLSFGILIAFHFFVIYPLQQITEAAKQYTLGNLEYDIPIDSHDEIGDLSASLNYMSSHLKDMEDYQKKFIANVSHDFRSPLTSIKGYLEAMADGTIPVEMQEKYFKILLSETERLTDLTSDLLTLNEFDTKNLMLNRTVFDIHEMIKNTAASFEGRCTTRFISIELLFASKTLYINADSRKIQRVLYNLLDNAIKFSPDHSQIVIETTEHSEKVFISVKDHGVGIPKKDIHKVWERFYKSDTSRGKDKKGTGLGLAIVKEIVQAHSENINIISTEGVGTEFIFSMPKG